MRGSISLRRVSGTNVTKSIPAALSPPTSFCASSACIHELLMRANLFAGDVRDRLGDALVIVLRRGAGNAGAADELAVDQNRRAAGAGPELVGIKARHAGDEIISGIIRVALHRLLG